MAKLTFKDGNTEFVDYNTAAKVWQVMNGNELVVPLEERPAIQKLAEKTEKIDFKAMSKG